VVSSSLKLDRERLGCQTSQEAKGGGTILASRSPPYDNLEVGIGLRGWAFRPGVESTSYVKSTQKSRSNSRAITQSDIFQLFRTVY